MELFLTLVGAAVAFGIGWVLARSTRSVGTVEAPSVTPDSEVMVADVLEHHPTGVVVGRPDGSVSYRNAAATSLRETHIGVLLDEAIERHLAEGRRGDRSDEVLELYGPPRSVVEVEAHPVDGGGAVVFVADISERRRIDQVRTDFVANISHELKTPIGALSVLAEMLEDETDPETVRRVVARMQGEAARATRTIDDLMELSRIELGGERSIESVRVADVVRGAVERVTELAAQHDIRITVLGPVDGEIDHADQLVIEGDRRQLVSAIGNLVENAVKYSEPGGMVQIEVGSDDDSIEIAVIDHGVGIPQRDLSRIFERFYRVDRARSRTTGGTGLGLSIVRHVATNHDGDVVVTSTEGEGSRFVLCLPNGIAELRTEPITSERDEGVT